MQDNALQDKVAFITGGAQRLGATTASCLHQAGMKLVIHYRSSDQAAKALQHKLNKTRTESVALVKGDLLEVDGIQQLVSEAIQAFGRLDAVINNASSFYPTPLDQSSVQNWEDLIGSNLRAPFFVVQQAAKELRKNHGCVVNMVDIHGFRPLKNYSIYSIAKAGLISATKALAKELAPEVRVNAIAPGAILWPENDSDQTSQQAILDTTPLRRTGTMEEIAQAIRFLIERATFTTGHVIPIDGGRLI